VLHSIDEKRDTRGDIIVREKSGERVHRCDSLLLDLRLQVMHATLNDRDQASELGTKRLAEKILLEGLLLGSSKRDLGLVGHLLQQLVGTDSSLPFSGLPVEILSKGGKEASNEGLRTKNAKGGIEAVLGCIADDGALIRQSVEGNTDKATVLEEENYLADRLSGEEALKNSTEKVLAGLAAETRLLISSSLLDLSNDAVVVQASDADRRKKNLAKAVASIDRRGRGLCSEDSVEEVVDGFLRWRGRGVAGRRRNRMRHRIDVSLL
jgi:hypothetical protein